MSVERREEIFSCCPRTRQTAYVAPFNFRLKLALSKFLIFDAMSDLAERIARVTTRSSREIECPPPPLTDIPTPDLDR